jgi:hypothetical protein
MAQSKKPTVSKSPLRKRAKGGKSAVHHAIDDDQEGVEIDFEEEPPAVCDKKVPRLEDTDLLSGGEFKDDDPDDEPETIGYCNPPKANQWKKGQSGNPAGRKAAKAKDQRTGLNDILPLLSEIISEILSETHEVPSGRGKENMPLLEIIMRSYFTQVAKAGVKDKHELFKILMRPEVLQTIAELLRRQERNQRYQGIYTEEHRRLLEIARQSAGLDDDDRKHW